MQRPSLVRLGMANGGPGRRWSAGVVVFMLGALGIAIMLAIFFPKGTARQLEDVLVSHDLHAGDVVLSDLQRLGDALTAAASSGRVDAKSIQRVNELADLVRQRNISLEAIPSHIGAAEPLRELAEQVDDALKDVDAASAAGWPDMRYVADQVYLSAVFAREYLARHSETLRQAEEATFQRYISNERKVRIWLGALLAAVTLVSMVTLFLLHQEVTNKQRRRSAEARAAYLAYFDPLTELANRSRFQDTLAKHVLGQAPFSLLMFDLDKFKMINDTHGHAAGDVVLACFGARLGRRTEPLSGLAARLGGDEFAAILPTDDPAAIEQFCQQIMEDAIEPIPFDGSSLSIRVSIGGASSSTLPDIPGTTEELLLSAADFALYAAKEAGRSTVRFYDDALAYEQSEQRNLIAALPVALEQGDLIPHYQPKVDMLKNRIIGFEALVRWQHNGRLIPPGAFLPMAEQAGLILDIDRTVLRQATEQMAFWNEMQGEALSVSVNLSTSHFRTDQIIQDVSDALTASGLEPWLLTLEITETVLIEDWERVNTILAELKALGVLISLDDFGTGYSSLAYLRKLAADELKIDSEFMQDIARSEETRFLLDAIVDMAHTMHMSIVVEGIETQEQADIVVDFGCRQGQGYFWSPPLSRQKIELDVLPNLFLGESLDKTGTE